VEYSLSEPRYIFVNELFGIVIYESTARTLDG
jgi:hypothetical protein